MAATSRRNGSRPPPVMLVSEAARERETFKLESYLFADFRFNYGGGLLPSSQITTSSDTILTSLAQLGIYRTGTERAFVSLFDARHQYIIAEATPDTPLAPAVPSDDCATPILQCGTAIPRNLATCDHVLYVTNPGSENAELKDETELPISVIPDLTANAEFSWRPYCQFGEGGQFYAGVPIRSHRGVNIGTYCVFSSDKMESWNEQSARHMRNVSQSIAQHLEASRSKIAYRRSERLNRGLSSFVQGKATLSAWRSGPDPTPFTDRGLLEGIVDAAQPRSEHPVTADRVREPGPRPHAPKVANDPTPGLWISELSKQPAAATSLGLPESPVRGDSGERIAGHPTSMSDLRQPDTLGSDGRSDTEILYSNASNIIREAFEVPGCFFFDVTLGYYGVSNVQLQSRATDPEPGSPPSSTSSSDEPSAAIPEETNDAVCDVLGFSTMEASSLNSERPNHTEGTVPKRLLAKLLRRYPNGKIFNFDAVGELQSSDSSGDDVPSPSVSKYYECANGSTTTGKRRDPVERRFSRKREGDIIHRIFPDARSVAFMPVWDSKRERWLAGGFIYTLTPSRVFTVEGELSFFKAFANLMVTEVQNLETLQTEKAKSDTLGSLSHELRSPLHGVILSTELLNDTNLSVFQGNATHTIEICCRTLLDTIDHLLDYSKVTNFKAARKQDAIATPYKPKKKTRSEHYGKNPKTLHSTFLLDGLVEEVVESIFAGCVFQHMSVRQLAGRAKSAHADIAAHNRLDFLQAMEQLGPTPDSKSQRRLQFQNVSVYLVADTCDWKVYSLAGAIRRIVMNLVGNSLKYTSSGAVRITMSQEPQNPHSAKRNRGERMVTLTVQDTGKGISEDYLRHKLFKPFAQEDELAPGTGLGLSLVKKIVSQLHGQIKFESQIGYGTTVSVTLPLRHSSETAELTDDDQDYEKHVKELTSLRVRLCGFESWRGFTGATDGRAIVEDTCRRSLHLDVIPDGQAHQLAPEVILWSEDSLPGEPGPIAQLSEAPNVVVCRDALVAYQRSTACTSAGQDGIFEFISQPISPRKLAKAVHVAYKRWMRDYETTTLHLVRPFGPSRMCSSSSVLQTLKEPSAHQEAIRPGQNADHNFPSLLPLNFAAPVPPQTPITEHKEEQSTGEPIPVLEQNLTGGRILLVDDNHINLKVLSAFMRKLAHPYEAAINGKEALEAYVRTPNQFVVILMDISMPVMDGLEATRRIRAYEKKHRCRPVVILVLTGLATDIAHQEAVESGVDVFLTKPVRLKALNEVLESLHVSSTPETIGL